MLCSWGIEQDTLLSQCLSPPTCVNVSSNGLIIYMETRINNGGMNQTWVIRSDMTQPLDVGTQLVFW